MNYVPCHIPVKIKWECPCNHHKKKYDFHEWVLILFHFVSYFMFHIFSEHLEFINFLILKISY